MPNWGQVLTEIESLQNPLDTVRHKYLDIMHQYTGRNIISYYSAFLQKPRNEVSIDDNDKNAFMQAICGLDKRKGLDLILHTPGGSIAATESLIKYLRSVFGTDIRAFIPQTAMSVGTMIALSCKELVMGKQSNIGPIDPQFGGVSCAGVIEEFENAADDIKNNPSSTPLWAAIISKYHPTFIGDCSKAIKWSEEMVKEWLCSNMLCNEDNKDHIAQTIVEKLGSHKETFSHSRHIHIDECEQMGIKVVPLESLDKSKRGDCKDLQDCVLTIHHAYMHTFSISSAIKIVENHLGNRMVILAQKA